MKIYLIRHGRTIGNEASIVQGWIGGELSQTGVKKANATAESVAKINPDIIISSDLNRCAKTAEILNNNKVLVLHDWRLRERHFGDLEGNTSKGQDWLDYFSINDPKHMFDEEPAEDVYGRAKDFVRSLTMLDKSNDTVLIVTHGGIVNVLKTIELGTDYTPKPYDNCEIVELNYDLLVKSSF